VNFKQFEHADKADELEKVLNDMTPKVNNSMEELQAALLASGPHTGGGMMVSYKRGAGTCDIDDDGCLTFKSSNSNGRSWYRSYCAVKITEGTPTLTVKSFDLGRFNRGWGARFITTLKSGAPIYTRDSSLVSGQKVQGFFNVGYAYSPYNVKVCASFGSDEKSTHGNQYYSLMYFVDKAFANVPSTCSGTPVGQPIYGKNYHTCATACDQDVHHCKGFFFYPAKSGSLCFLLSDFKTATYWTGCGSSSSSFLQAATKKLEAPYKPFGDGEEPEAPICAAKLSEYNGLSLKPDGSGKCEHCLKDLKKADRCYQ
jgi:hypothetical protein